MVVARHDAYDLGRNLQSGRIRFHRCYSGHANGSAVCRDLRHSIHHFLEGTLEFCWKSWMFQLHHWIGCYRSQRTRAVSSRKNSGYEEVGARAWLP